MPNFKSAWPSSQKTTPDDHNQLNRLIMNKKLIAAMLGGVAVWTSAKTLDNDFVKQ
jgi:hypothetical protein